MKKILLIIFTLILFNVSAQDQFSIRGIPFGSSKKDVLKKEKDKPAVDTRDVLLYTTYISDNFATLGYTFQENKLTSVSMNFPGHKSSRGYSFAYNQFNEFKKALIQKYGEPILDTLYINTLSFSNLIESINLNQLTKKDSLYILTKRIGYCLIKWDLDDEVIIQQRLRLNKSYELDHKISYFDKKKIKQPIKVKVKSDDI